jgi:hypothetical protein
VISPLITIILFLPLVVLSVHRGEAFEAACFAFIVGLQADIAINRWFRRKRGK